MSLSELTRNSFQSGVSAKKWVNLCKLFLTNNNIHAASDDIQSSISNSVLILFHNYPGDPGLQAYLKYAIQDGLLSLAKFVSTFLSAARSLELHNAATLDMLCRVALDSHYESGIPPIGSLVAYSESAMEVMGTVQDAMALIRTAHSLPMSHFHQLTTSASELLVLLLSCAVDVSQVSTAQASMLFMDAADLLQTVRLAPAVYQKLESFVGSIHKVLVDGEKAAREEQIMQTLHLATGKSSLDVGPETDPVTLGLMFHSIITARAHAFGAGDSKNMTALLLAWVRWSSWSPAVFYSQLLLSAITCLAEQQAIGAPHSTALLWRSFVIGRLPFLLSMLQKVAESTGSAETDWQPAFKLALTTVLRRSDVIEKCDANQHFGHDMGVSKATTPRPFVLEFLHQSQSAGLIDSSYAATLHPELLNDFRSRLETEAQDAGMNMKSYFETKLAADTNIDDASALLERMCADPCSHAVFAHVVEKRVRALVGTLDVEPLSFLCKAFYRCEAALDILSLHIRISDFVACILAFIEDYDCETVGDPQTAVSHLGEVVLFVQETIARFDLTRTEFVLDERRLSLDIYKTAARVRPMTALNAEETNAFHAWYKALFDTSSEGIEDTILRNTRPRTLLRITATLFAHAITMCARRRIDKDVLNNGISYFLGVLLNWTLSGIVKSLLVIVQHEGLDPSLHLEVLQTLVLSTLCPRTVIRLSASSLLRAFPAHKQERAKIPALDTAPIRRVALESLNLPVEESNRTSLSLGSQNSSWTDVTAQAISTVLSAAQAGKAHGLDVDRALVVTSPTTFLHLLWTECMKNMNMGSIEAAKRVATFVLVMPRRPRSPPLLPIFLHGLLPGLVAAVDTHNTADFQSPADAHNPAQQAMTVELIGAIVSSALTAALHLEWALHTACDEQRPVLGHSATAMARRLGSDLRNKSHGPTSAILVQRLASSPSFMTNFPTFMAA
ncbi:uncharacterized protein LAESUDRAFT_726512 [Laetiporus sulphureus 93-53]|uniref:Mediator of RNA polymerase II transcription subunit 5 n=1 Tax=Laetiporus sulphureus 93-53 TaxID=1314785 RepID=A0A165DZB9_9APHY|nr:uncharacterized protein LAESUDRAFT_726512 [Laetiporus sulphureus 93-53]KZT05944.1 hypothetical protein LAESUDRAFT_726512 [Laetiporus sulphureus 93-53]